jgi:hypothetical protein
MEQKRFFYVRHPALVDEDACAALAEALSQTYQVRAFARLLRLTHCDEPVPVQAIEVWLTLELSTEQVDALAAQIAQAVAVAHRTHAIALSRALGRRSGAIDAPTLAMTSLEVAVCDAEQRRPGWAKDRS